MPEFTGTLIVPFNSVSGRWESGYVPPEPDDWIAGQPPVLSSASTFSDGGNMTITGSNFSKNRQTQLVYHDFSDGTAGQLIATNPIWTSLDPDHAYVYDDNGLATGKKCAYLDMRGTYDYFTAALIPECETLYVEHWINYQLLVTGPDDGSGAPQMKLTRAGAGTSIPNHSDNPNMTFTFADVNATQGVVGDGVQVHFPPAKPTNDAGQSIAGYMHLPPNGQWHKLHMATKLSDLGVANGWRYFKTSVAGEAGDCAVGSNTGGSASGKHVASPNGIVAKTAWAGEPWATRFNAADPNYKPNTGFQKIILPYFTRSYQESDVRVAGFWANDTAERVVISTSPDWNTALKTGIIQPCVSKTNNQWVVKNELGNLPATGQLYAHLVNADGVFNTTGLPVSRG